MTILSLKYTDATVFESKCCRACYNAGKRSALLNFTKELCAKFDTRPVYKIPHWRNRMRGLIRQHYKSEHPEWRVT